MVLPSKRVLPKNHVFSLQDFSFHVCLISNNENTVFKGKVATVKRNTAKGAKCTGRKPYILNIGNIVDRFESVVLGSGDGILTEIVCRLQDADCNVTLFDAVRAQISYHLRHAVHGIKHLMSAFKSISLVATSTAVVA